MTEYNRFLFEKDPQPCFDVTYPFQEADMHKTLKITAMMRVAYPENVEKANQFTNAYEALRKRVYRCRSVHRRIESCIRNGTMEPKG